MRRNYQKLYDIYAKNYFNKIQKSPVPMDDPKKFEQFKVSYQAIYNAKVKDNEKPVNIIRDMITGQQQFKYSTKQAKALKTAIREKTGVKITAKSIRTSKDNPILAEFMGDIKADYANLISKGYTPKDAGKYISRVYFDSP